MAGNDISKISEGLKKISVGGITVLKVKGRGKTIPPSIHASKGTEIFTPEFGDKYMLMVVLPDTKKDDAVRIIKENSKIGKIFATSVVDAIDLATGLEGDQAI
jgi:nitrogen regulatory protein P-II 1